MSTEKTNKSNVNETKLNYKKLYDSLNGIRGMSKEDVSALYGRFPELPRKSLGQQDRVARNVTFSNHLDEMRGFYKMMMPDLKDEEFNKAITSPEIRDDLYKEWVAYKLFNEQHKENKEFDVKRYSTLWNADDKLNFYNLNLASNDYIETNLRKPLEERHEMEANSPIYSYYMHATASGPLTEYHTQADINDIVNKAYINRDAKLHDFHADILRRSQNEKGVKDAVQQYYETHYANKSKEEINAEFDQVIEPSDLNIGIPTYAAYRGTKELANMSAIQKATVLSKYFAYQQLRWHPHDIRDALDNDAKDYIADNQSFITVATMAVGDVFNTMAVGIGQEIAGWKSVGLGIRDLWGNPKTYYRTLDENGEIVPTADVIKGDDGRFYYKKQDEEGNIQYIPVEPTQLNSQTAYLAGYNEDGTKDDSWLNPQFLSDAFRFGTFNEEYIEKAKKYGLSLGQPMWGSSAQSNIIYEGFKQTGFVMKEVAKEVVLSRLTGGAGKFISPTSKIANAALKITDKTFRIANAISGAEGNAFANAMEVYNETYSENMKALMMKASDEATKEVRNFIDLNPEKFNQEVIDEKERIKEEIKNRYASSEDFPYIMPSDEILHEEAMDRVIEKMTKDALGLVLNDRKKYGIYLDEAYQTATSAANNQNAVNLVHSTVANLTLLRSLYMNKQDLINAYAKRLGKRVKVDAEGNINWKDLTTKQKVKILARETIKQSVGEGIDEFTENLEMGGATYYGRGMFNKYLDGTFDAKKEAETSNILGSIYTYLPAGFLFAPSYADYRAGFFEKFLDENAWYEGGCGFIGGLMPYVNLNGIVNFRSQREAWQKEGYNPSILELTSQFVSSTAINEYYAAIQGYRQDQKAVEEIIDFYSKIDPDIIKNLAQDGLLFANAGTVDDVKTASFIQQLNTIQRLEEVAKNPELLAVIGQVPAFNQTVQLWNALKDGKLSDEQKAQVLDHYYKQNPSAKKSEQEDEKALQTVLKNVEDIKEAKQRIEDAREQIKKVREQNNLAVNEEAESRIITMAALSKKFADRIATMQEEISGGTENAASATVELMSYGASSIQVSKVIDKKAKTLKKKIDGHNANIVALQKQKEALNKDDADYEKKLEKIEKDIALENQEIKYAQHDIELGENTKAQLTSLEEAIIAKFDEENPGNTLSRSQKLRKAITAENFFGFKITNSKKSVDQVKQFIRNLEPKARARLVSALLTFKNGEKSKFFNNSVGNILVKAFNELYKEDPDIINKILDVPRLMDHIELSDLEIEEALQDPKLFEYKLRKRQLRALEVAQDMQTDFIVSGLIKFLNNVHTKPRFGETKQQKADVIYSQLKTIKAARLRDLLKSDHVIVSKYYDEIQKALKHQEALEDLGAIAKSTGNEKNVYEILTAIASDQITSSEELLKALNDLAVDENTDNQSRDKFAKMANALQELMEQRGSTEVQTDDQKKEIEEKRQAAKEKYIKRQEELKKKAEEEKKKQQEEEEKKKEKENKEEKKEEEKKEEEKKEENKKEEEKKEEDNDTDDIEFTPTEEVNFNNTPSLESQVAVNSNENVEVAPSNTPKESEALATSEVKSNTVLAGNVMPLYEYVPLRDSGYQIRKKGANPNDEMNRYYDWLKNKGINIQKTIDEELSEIIKVNNKVRLLRINPVRNSTNDDHMSKFTLLVIEYNDEVAKIHKNSDDLITANGKKWVVVGTLGYRGTEQQNEFNRIQTKLNSDASNYFENNKTERFYVDENSYTEISSINSGYISRRLEGDENVELRSISELLNDPQRNPDGLSMENLAWGIAENGKFVSVGLKGKDYATPNISSLFTTSGNIYLMIKAANGMYIPVAIRNVTYGEIKEGTLKDLINALLRQAVSYDVEIRKSAITKLVRLLYLNKDDKTILVGDNKHNTVSIVGGGVVTKTWNIDNNFSEAQIQEFLKAVEALNPRINITLATLSSPTELKILDEAGVLITDAASLRTSGAIYNIYNIGENGKPIIENAVTSNPNAATGSGRSRSDVPTVFYNGKTYRFRNGAWMNDTETAYINEPNLLKIIEINNLIDSNNLSVFYTSKGWDYYLINADPENPVMYRRKSTTMFAEQLTPEDAKRMIKGVNEEKQNAEREKAAKEKLENNGTETQPKPTANNKNNEGDATELDKIMEEHEKKNNPNPEIKEEDKQEKENQQKPKKEDKSMLDILNPPKVTTAEEILCDLKLSSIFYSILDTKVESGEWEGNFDSVKEVLEFLKNKGVPIEGISDVDSWLQLVRDCVI